MLLQKINKRQGIFNNILRSGDMEKLHSLKFDYLQENQRWRIAPRHKDKEFGRIGWTWFWVLGISIVVYMAIYILRSRV